MKMNNPITIVAHKKGPEDIVDEIFPLRYGRYAEIFTPEYRFLFNLNGEVKAVSGLGAGWPHPGEQLKRTDGNDWIYYTVGDDSSDRGVRSWMGEYYLPCLSYPSNPIWLVDFFSKPVVMRAYAAWYQLYSDLANLDMQERRPEEQELVRRILENNDDGLRARAKELHEIIGGRVSVLPPDTRHVDYEVIPLNIADGCLYHCRFCCVKTDNRFQIRSRDAVLEQMERLQAFHGPNLVNYKALFLGNHDALAAGQEALLFAAREAYERFGFASRETPPYLFLFGSVGSLLKAEDSLFSALDGMRYRTCINIGLESVHGATLEMLGKPITPQQVRTAFERILDINSRFDHVRLTANFVLGDTLDAGHVESLTELLREHSAPDLRGNVFYLSPLQNSSHRRELLPVVRTIQESCNFTVLLYLIQRL